jgi:hypothetical protein
MFYLLNKKITSMKKLVLSLIILISVLSVKHASAQWSASVNLSPASVSAGQNESMGSCIAVSGDTVHVVWSDQRSSTKAVIYYTRSPDAGLTWSAPVAITDTNGNAWNPAIAVNGRNIHVVWRNIVNNIRSSYYKRSLDGGNTWRPSVLLDSAVADWPAVTVSGNNVYVANDIVTSAVPYNTEIFFLSSSDNGANWSSHTQITFSAGRSEDEAITAQGADVFMSWNDNRNGTMQIFSKHSGNNGVSWDADVLVNSEPSYGTMVSVNGANVDVPSAGATSGRYQIHLNQSPNGGITWGTDINLTNDTAHTYYYPYMVRDGADLHMTYVKSGVGGQYIHSADGGATWSAPFSMGNAGITPFVAITGCVVHLVWANAGHIYYARNPIGNIGHCENISTSSLPSSVCKGSSVSVSYSASGPYIAGNTFTAQLSDASGSFASAVNIGSLSSTVSGIISAVIPSNSATGSGYRIRVLSNNPAITGSDNGNNIAINPLPAATISTNGPTTFCSGANPLMLTANAGAGLTYQWKKGPNIISGATAQTYIPTMTSTAYKVIVTNSNGCSKISAGVAVTVNPLPAATITPQGPTTFCAGGSVVLQANGGGGLTYQWKKGANNIGGATLQNYNATTGGNYKVIVTNANSCSKTSAGTVVTINCRLSNTMIDESKMEIYPNPASASITVSLQSGYANAQMKIINMTGQTVMQKQITSYEEQFDISMLPSGIYTVIVNTERRIEVKRFTKE